MSLIRFRWLRKYSRIRYTRRYTFHSSFCIDKTEKIPHWLVSYIQVSYTQMPINLDFSSLCSPREQEREERKCGIHTSIIVVRFKPGWCIFRELIRAANVRSYNLNSNWVTDVHMYLHLWANSHKAISRNLKRRGIANEKARPKKREMQRKEKWNREKQRRGRLTVKIRLATTNTTRYETTDNSSFAALVTRFWS